MSNSAQYVLVCIIGCIVCTVTILCSMLNNKFIDNSTDIRKQIGVLAETQTAYANATEESIRESLKQALDEEYLKFQELTEADGQVKWSDHQIFLCKVILGIEVVLAILTIFVGVGSRHKKSTA